MNRPAGLWLVVGVSSAVLLGCVATWVVMDIRLRREKESMREEIRKEMQTEVRGAIKDGIKGAADEMLTKEYLEKKVTEETSKLLSDPNAIPKTAEQAADTGVKLGAGTAKGVLGAVTKNEKEIRDLGKLAGDAARVGLDTLFDAAGRVLQGPPAPTQKGEGRGEKGEGRDEIDPRVGQGAK